MIIYYFLVYFIVTHSGTKSNSDSTCSYWNVAAIMTLLQIIIIFILLVWISSEFINVLLFWPDWLFLCTVGVVGGILGVINDKAITNNFIAYRRVIIRWSALKRIVGYVLVVIMYIGVMTALMYTLEKVSGPTGQP